MFLLRAFSFSHWRRHRFRTALTVAALATGVAAIAATSTVSDSILGSFERSIDVSLPEADLFVANGGVGVPGSLLPAIRGLDSVVAAAPYVEGFVSPDSVNRDSHDERRLLIVGVDLLADSGQRGELAARTLQITDELEFIAQADSIAVGRRFADENGLALGRSLAVMSPTGAVTLVVRGLLDDVGPVALLGGAVGVMDLPAAQQLLGKSGRVDRIDVRLREGADGAASLRELESIVGGHGHVSTAQQYRRRAEDLLLPLRVALALGGAGAVVVGFFIIFHTIKTSLVERSEEIALVGVLGFARASLMRWLVLESLFLGMPASVMGIVLGLALARVAIAAFGGVASAWVRIASPDLVVNPWSLLMASAIGVGTAVAAAVGSGWPIVRKTRPVTAHRGLVATRSTQSFGPAVALALLGFCLAASIAAMSPPTLPYAQLVSIILAINVLVLLSFGVLAPIPTLLLGWAMGRGLRYWSGPALLLAVRRLTRHPAAPAACVSAVVMAFGWTLANASTTLSFKDTWFGWFDDNYRSDVVINSVGAERDILTATPFSESVVSELEGVPGVAIARGIRRVEMEVANRRAMLVALDKTAMPIPTLTRDWELLRGRFWDGKGVLVSDTLARRTGIEPGDSLHVNTPSGAITPVVLDLYRDVYGGDLGAVTIARSTYRRLWRDLLVDRAEVVVEPSADVEVVRTTMDSLYADKYGLQFLRYDDAQNALRALIDDAFTISYALLFVCIVVSSVGVLNFLLSAVVNRTREYAAMAAIGLSGWQIMRSVMLEGALVGAIGSMLGVLAGMVTSAIIVGHSIPMITGWVFTLKFAWELALVLSIATVAVSMVSSIVPGWIASHPAGGGHTQE